MARPWRSWLYVPGVRPDRIHKAILGEADCVVIDLEDSVIPARKAEARQVVAELLRTPTSKPILVRINELLGPWGEEDLAAVALPHVQGIRVPKVSDPNVVRQAADMLRSLKCPASLFLLLENARAVEHAFDLAQADERVGGLGLGEADLTTDLRINSEDGLTFARSRVVMAARAAGLPPPVQSVFTQLGNDHGLRASTRKGRILGFYGRSVIHPSQIPIVHEICAPSAKAVIAARTLIAALDDARQNATGYSVLPGGRFVDSAAVESARWTLALSEDSQ